MLLAVYSAMIVQIIIYFIKVAFELNLNLGVLTNGIELIHLCCLSLAIIMALVR
jgi:hypothetical protein